MYTQMMMMIIKDLSFFFLAAAADAAVIFVYINDDDDKKNLYIEVNIKEIKGSNNDFICRNQQVFFYRISKFSLNFFVVDTNQCLEKKMKNEKRILEK